MVRRGNTGQVEVLKLQLPESYWPLEFQQLGDSVAVQLHAAGRQWLVVLQKGKAVLGGLPASPVYLDDQQRQVADAALNLVKAAGTFVDQSDRLSQSQKPSLDRLSLEDLVRGATIRVYNNDRVCGSGVITEFLGKRYVVTANHVARAASTHFIRVRSLKDETEGYLEDLVARDTESDLAIFAAPVDLVHLPGVPLLDGEVPTGQPVYLSGFPHGYYHLTEGQVTGFKPRGRAMLHTASSLGGTSGGMLITPSGELCGIHVGGTRPGSKDYPHKLAIPSPLIAELLRKSD